MGSTRAGDIGPIPAGVTIHRLPSTIADLNEFLARVAGESSSGAATASASGTNSEIVRAA
jgi:hypothetical protein